MPTTLWFQRMVTGTGGTVSAATRGDRAGCFANGCARGGCSGRPTGRSSGCVMPTSRLSCFLQYASGGQPYASMRTRTSSSARRTRRARPPRASPRHRVAAAARRGVAFAGLRGRRPGPPPIADVTPPPAKQERHSGAWPHGLTGLRPIAHVRHGHEASRLRSRPASTKPDTAARGCPRLPQWCPRRAWQAWSRGQSAVPT